MTLMLRYPIHSGLERTNEKLGLARQAPIINFVCRDTDVSCPGYKTTFNDYELKVIW